MASSISSSEILLPATEKNNSHKGVISKTAKLGKSAALCKIARVKKVVKYRWQPRNGCDGRSVAKILQQNSGEFGTNSL